MLQGFFTKERLVIDFICAMYIMLLAPYVKDIVTNAMYGWTHVSTGAIIAGAVILCINGLEAFALAPYISTQINSVEDKGKRFKAYTPVLLLLLLHAAISISSILVAFKVWGIDTQKNLLILVIAMVLLFLKEIYLIKNSFSNNPRAPLSPIISKLIIIIFSSLMFTIFWDATAGKITGNNAGATLVNSVGASIFFAFFYYPLRIPFIMPAIIKKPSMQERLIGFVSFLIVLIPALMKRM